jgi:hypothetical protein
MKHVVTITLLSLILLSFSCAQRNGTNQEQPVYDTKTTLNCDVFFGTWKIAFPNMLMNDTLYTNYTLRFTKACGFEVKLRVNICGAKFEIVPENSIKVTSAVCTEACCDDISELPLASGKWQVQQIHKDTLKLIKLKEDKTPHKMESNSLLLIRQY